MYWLRSVAQAASMLVTLRRHWEHVVIHRFSSILSAYGMALADLTNEIQRPRSEQLSQLTATQLQQEFQALGAKKLSIESQGFPEHLIEFEMYLNLRYKETNRNLMIRKPEGSWDFASVFAKFTMNGSESPWTATSLSKISELVL